MSSHRGQYDKFEKLRERAEKLILRNTETEPEKNSEVAELIHELKIQYAELELQNEELKESQQELSTLHQKYEHLFEFAPCGYIIMDASGIMQQINLTAAGMLGINRNSLTAHTSFINYLANGWKDAFRELLVDFKKNCAELKLADKEDGYPNWIRVDIMPVQHVVDSGAQWQMTIMDITERKQTEGDLPRPENYNCTIFENKGSEKEVIQEDSTISHVDSNFTDQSGYLQYEINEKKSCTEFIHTDDLDILESLNELVVNVDLEYRFNYVNQAYCKIFDKSSEELLGQLFLPLVHEEDIEDTLKSMQSLYTPPYRKYVEQRAMTVNGWRCIAWENNGIIDENGEVVEILAEGRDITDQKLAEEALRHSENYYRSIFESSASAIFIIEEDTTISHVNPKFLALFGYSREEVEGKKSWTEFVHPDDVKYLQEIHCLHRENSDSVPLQYEFRGITCNGMELSILASVDMIPGTNRSIASGIEVTEHKQKEFKKSLQESAPSEDNASGHTNSRGEVTADAAIGKKEVFQETELFSQLGDLGLMQALLLEVLTALPKRLLDLKKAAENGNAQDVNTNARYIKGMARIISAHRVSETAYKLEALGTKQDLSGVKELISELEIEFDLLKTELTEKLFDYL